MIESRGMDEVVVVLHGLMRTRLSMWLVERDLRRAGYRVLNETYASIGRRVEAHAEALAARFAALDSDATVARIHVVTHSLGGIITRAALAARRPAKMGRVVMLAPPNRGSRAARLASRALGRFGTPLDALSDAEDSLVNRLRVPAGVEIGVIAARWDAKVPVDRTHLAGETDHLVVPGFHTFFMNRREVRRQTTAFLRLGRFSRESAASRRDGA